jgi:hypothetical protein
MPTLSGIYTSLTGQTLAIDEHCYLRVIHNDKQKMKLRADADFWLCEDDGVSTLPATPYDRRDPCTNSYPLSENRQVWISQEGSRSPENLVLHAPP